MSPNVLFKIKFIHKSQNDGDDGYQEFIYLIWEEYNKLAEIIKKAEIHHLEFNKELTMWNKIEITIIEGQLLY